MREDVAVVEEAASDNGESNLGSGRSLCEGLTDEVIFNLVLYLSSLLGFIVSSATGEVVRGDREVSISALAVWKVDDVGEEWDEGYREGKARKEKVAVGKDTPGGTVGRVLSAWNVLGAYIDVARGLSEEGMDTFEYIVGLVVSVTTVPPSFDNSCVVSIDEKIPALRDKGVESADE